MTRLNYTARRISGIRAGQAVKKDLKKRIPLSSTFRLRDPVLEIDISGKQLTDEGFSYFILDLRCALEYKNAEYPQGINKLQEMHLQGNSLSVDSLVELAKVISLSSKDLKELDLSKNKINIVTNTDVQKWQYFLESFSQCCVLKKVDFSDNLLGSRGVEALARVFIRSELDFVEFGPVDTDLDTAVVGGVQHDSHSTVQGGKSSQRRGSQVTPATTSKVHTDAELRHFACTRGLRSVPYIMLQNVAMTNRGIIHLVEMIKLHRTPEHLLSFLPSGKLPSLPADTEETALRGIHWLPNETLSPLSIKLMRLTSQQLQQLSAESESCGEDEMADEFHDMMLDEDESYRRKRQKLNVQLNRVIKRHRIDVLGSEGMIKSEIWQGALKMLAVSRAILLDDKNRPPSVEEELQASRKLRLGSDLKEEKHMATPATPRPPRPPPIPAPVPVPASEQLVQRSTNDSITPRGVMISTFRFDPESSTFDIMFPAMHAPPAHPVLQARPPPVAVAMPGYPSSPVTRASTPQQKTTNSSASTTEGHAPHNRTTNAAAPNATTNNNNTSSTSASTNTPEKHRFGLPLHIWAKIIPQAVGVHRVLHPDQQMKILSYAASWNALAAEVSINGAPEHQQLWKILDSMDCFEYKPLS